MTDCDIVLTSEIFSYKEKAVFKSAFGFSRRYDVKRRGAGFFLTWLSILMAADALISYLRNCRTHYFLSFGIDRKIVILLLTGVVLQIVLLVFSVPKFRVIGDAISIALPAVYMAALVAFLSARLTEIAFIFTFENNASNMADLQSALAGIVFCVLAVILSLIAAWFDIRKDVEA